MKKICWNFNRSDIKTLINFGRINMFTMLSRPTCEHSMSLHLFRSLISFISI